MALNKTPEGSFDARVAHREDLDDLAKLCRLAFEEHRRSRGGTVHSALQPLAGADVLLLGGYLDSADHGIFVVRDAGDLVGFGIVGVLEGKPAVRVASVDAIYVAPGKRRRGYGQVIVDRVVDWARLTGCEGIDISALPGDRATKSFLEQAGFRARLLVMHHSIGSIDVSVEPGEDVPG